MKSLFESSRLYFREFMIEDAEGLYLLNLDPEVIRYTGDPPFESITAAKHFIENYDHYQLYGFGRWAMIRKEDDAFLGWCGIKYNEDKEIDIGFRLMKKYWNRGYASEAALATINFSRSSLKINILVARAAKENIASLRVLEKLGFSYVNRVECHGIKDAMRFVLME